MYGHAMIAATTSLQKKVSLGSTEAEYVGALETVNHSLALNCIVRAGFSTAVNSRSSRQ